MGFAECAGQTLNLLNLSQRIDRKWPQVARIAQAVVQGFIALMMFGPIIDACV